MAPETVASGSPDAMHARAEGSAHISQVRVTMPMSVWGVIALSVAAIIMAGLALYESSQIRMHEQLNAYDLSELKTNQVAYLIGKEQNDHDLIQAYGIAKIVRGKHVKSK